MEAGWGRWGGRSHSAFSSLHSPLEEGQVGAFSVMIRPSQVADSENPPAIFLPSSVGLNGKDGALSDWTPGHCRLLHSDKCISWYLLLPTCRVSCTPAGKIFEKTLQITHVLELCDYFWKQFWHFLVCRVRLWCPKSGIREVWREVCRLPLFFCSVWC